MYSGGPGVPECIVMTPALSPEPSAQLLLHFYLPLQYSFLLCLPSKNPAMLNNSDTNLEMVENAPMGTLISWQVVHLPRDFIFCYATQSTRTFWQKEYLPQYLQCSLK